MTSVSDETPRGKAAKQSPTKLDERSIELLLLALTGAREALWLASNALSLFGVSAALGAEMKRQIGVIDFATSSLGPDVGWTVNSAGIGSDVNPALRKRVDTWVARGKQVSDLNRQ